MKEKVFTALITIVIMTFIGIGTYNVQSSQVVPLTSETTNFHANNTTSFSTTSGAGSAVDLGEPVCRHNVTLYNSGAWLTVSVAPGLMIDLQGSNDGTNYVVFDTHWWTASGSSIYYQLTDKCFRYLKTGWMSSAGAYAWVSTGNGRVNALVTSGGTN